MSTTYLLTSLILTLIAITTLSLKERRREREEQARRELKEELKKIGPYVERIERGCETTSIIYRPYLNGTVVQCRNVATRLVNPELLNPTPWKNKPIDPDLERLLENISEEQ